MKTKIFFLIFSVCLLFSCSDKDDDLKNGSDWTVKLSVSNYQEDCSQIIFSALADNVALKEKTSQLSAQVINIVSPSEFKGKGKQLIIITAGGNCGSSEIPLNYVIEVFEKGSLIDTKTISVLATSFSETYIYNSK